MSARESTQSTYDEYETRPAVPAKSFGADDPGVLDQRFNIQDRVLRVNILKKAVDQLRHAFFVRELEPSGY